MPFQRNKRMNLRRAFNIPYEGFALHHTEWNLAGHLDRRGKSRKVRGAGDVQAAAAARRAVSHWASGRRCSAGQPPNSSSGLNSTKPRKKDNGCKCRNPFLLLFVHSTHSISFAVPTQVSFLTA